MKFLKNAVHFSIIVLATIPFAIGAILGCLSFRKEAPTFFMQWWAKFILWTCRINVEIKGLEKLSKDRPAIYMANHASILDIPILIAALPVDLRFVFKKSILWIPFLGIAIWAMGMIPIDRGNRSKASASLKKAGKRIRNGLHVLIFPEGTRSLTADLLPFKKGGFYLALEEHIDIVPISILNSRQLCGRNSVLGDKGTIYMHVHDRFPTTDYTLNDRAEVAAKMQKIIASELTMTFEPHP